MIKERLFWIDLLKCIAIFLVIMGHVSKPGFHEYNIIYSFHMPLFFMISGFLTSTKISFKQNIKKQIRSLILPTWILSLIVMPMDIARMYSHLNNNVILSYILNFMTCNLYWFIPTLFLMKVLFYPLMKTENYIMIAIVSLVSIIIGYSFGDIENQSALINNTLSRFRFIPFFLMGFSFKQQIYKFENDNKKEVLVIAIGIICIYILSYILFGSGEMNRLTNLLNLFLFYIQAFLITALFFILVKCVRSNRFKGYREFISKISECTLLIYILHFIPVILFRQIVDISVMEGEFKRIVIELIISLIIFIVFIPISSKILSKYPWLVGKK